MIRVVNGGFLTTVQDAGRYGYQNRGIPVSGVMDHAAYEKANTLVGNTGGEAVLEMTMFGGTYEFEEAARIAVTGANMHPVLQDGTPVPMNTETELAQGTRISFGAASSGCRCYLAVAGGIDVPMVMESRSTYVKYGIGGLAGRAVKRGDCLKVGIPLKSEHPKALAGDGPYADQITVRMVPGPQEDRFTAAGIQTFYGETYTVSEQSDRMGYRMEGPKVESICGTDILSDGTVFGSVQITGSGQPLILMADRQTTGGYAKIATVYSKDLPLLAQAKPGTKVQFVRMNEEDWM